MCKARNLKVLLSIMLVGIFMVVGLTGNPAFAATTLRLSHPMPADGPIGKSFDRFKAIVEKESKGELKIDVFPANVLGTEAEVVEQMLMGQLDIACSATTSYSGKSNTYLAFDLPYLFTSSAEWKYFLSGDDKGQFLRDLREYVLKKEGTVLLCTSTPAGKPKIVVNSKRIVRTPAEAKGIKIRVSPSPVEAALIKEWGFTPVPIPWSETFSAMSQKVVDGSVSSYLIGNQFSHFDVAKFAFEPEAVESPYMINMNLNKWKTLSPDQQDILIRAAEEIGRECWETMEAAEDAAKVKVVKEKRVQAHMPTAAEMGTWIKLAKEKVWPQFAPKTDQTVLNMVEKNKKLYQELKKKK
jgi:TRAP-type transport system periplasmic protein